MYLEFHKLLMLTKVILLVVSVNFKVFVLFVYVMGGDNIDNSYEFFQKVS